MTTDDVVEENMRLRQLLIEIKAAVWQAHDRCEKDPIACHQWHSFQLGVIGGRVMTVLGELDAAKKCR